MVNPVEEFERAAAAHGAAQSADVNPHADQLYAIGCRLRKSGALETLTSLLQHEDPRVRMWAATYLLEVDANRGATVLEQVAEIDAGLIGFSAEQTLREWRNGRLKLP